MSIIRRLWCHIAGHRFWRLTVYADGYQEASCVRCGKVQR